MEAIISPTNFSPEAFAGVSSGLLVLEAMVIGLRLWTNYNHIGRLYIDDYMCILALVFLTWNVISFTLIVQIINSNPATVTIPHLTTLIANGISAGNCAIFSAKLPLLFLLMRTFGVKTWLRRTTQFLIVFGIIGGMVTFLYAAITCSPNLHTPDPPFLLKCVPALENATIARGSISLAMDVAMFIIPIPIIAALKMPLRRRIGLGFAFATGLIAIVASAVGLWLQKAQTGGSSNNFVNALIVTIIEATVVCLVSCTPAIHLFWTKHAVGLRRQLGLRTINSTNKSKTRTNGSSQRSKLPPGSTSSDSDHIFVQTHHYVELDEAAGRGKPPYEADASSRYVHGNQV